ncbi:YHS domain-containing (seleno)protein [Devosia aurantiaca]|uniref:Twin-arginine translocation pathway signal protein n=1 Tax=Devosia aurantiaca TaxID=2714858 RepID=A0A6M1SMQ4_9HYPH|nr:YHS domain-containing (seleno)protein [Devosia aurantiaca]NGP18488.1 twin-arginine translocation pathway signal protein [Devosia aurantiaca]
MIAVLLPLFGLVAANGVKAQSIVSWVEADPLTGLAIGGMDPVSYFTEDAPLPGKPDYEVVWMGAPWLFANKANRDVFEKQPEIYAPQYGGHGAMSMARGFVSDADPLIYAVYKQRLYLFYSAANREAFLLAPDAAALRGQEHWQVLSKSLSTR